MKIGVITWHHGGNFGSVLQALALSEVLKELGYNAEIINYLPSPYGRITPLRNILFRCLSRFFLNFRSKVFPKSDLFRHNNISQSRPLYNRRELIEYAKDYDVIICGSDQIWAPTAYDDVYFGVFAAPKTRKISYAASIGLYDIPVELINKYQVGLKDFYAISVREDTGKELLERYCNINSEVCLDPTLLHEKSFYSKYEEQVDGLNEKYILCYFLKVNNDYQRLVDEYAKDNNLIILKITSSDCKSKTKLQLDDISPGSFLWLIRNAECIFTDSYHGTIFSMLYHKCYYTFERFEKTDPINQNSRLDQLKKYFGINTISSNTQLSDLPHYTFDYLSFDDKLRRLQLESIRFLKNALIDA